MDTALELVNYDAFHVIAEVAVTLTGFIGIVVVLQHRDHHFSRLGLLWCVGVAAYLFAMILFDESARPVHPGTGA